MQPSSLLFRLVAVNTSALLGEYLGRTKYKDQRQTLYSTGIMLQTIPAGILHRLIEENSIVVSEVAQKILLFAPRQLILGLVAFPLIYSIATQNTHGKLKTVIERINSAISAYLKIVNIALISALTMNQYGVIPAAAFGIAYSALSGYVYLKDKNISKLT